MHPSCVNILNIYTVLRNSQKITRDFQRFKRLVVCVKAITHCYSNFRSFRLKAVTWKQYYNLIELHRISDSVTVSAPKRSNIFVSENFDIAVSYICTLGTVSVTVVTRILVSASSESLFNSLSLLQFLLRLYSKLASSQWPTMTPDSQVSVFLQQGLCRDPRKQGHSGPLFSTLKISFELSTGWAEYRLGVELAHFVASAYCLDGFVFFC